jgi:hypothetical protein
MRTIQNFAAGVFMLCVAVLSVVSVLGVWQFFAGDVIVKSFETLGVLAIIAIVVVFAARFIGESNTPVVAPTDAVEFRVVRNITLAVLIVSAVALALVGVLAIWNVIGHSDVVYKSLSSVAILAFASLIIVMICLNREQNELWRARKGQLTGGSVIAAFVLAWILLATLNW